MTRSIPLFLLFAAMLHAATLGLEPINIGSRLELFVDNHLAGKFAGDAELHLHKPEPREVVLVADAPWEGNISGYFNVFQDGDLYRMYYRGAHAPTPETRGDYAVACYAESKDAIHWIKPKLGIFEAGGSKGNNIVWPGVMPQGRDGIDWSISSFVVFKDLNPNCAEEAKYKAFARHGPTRNSLYAFKSPDGIHWRLMSEAPVITKGALDSQNVAFWDTVSGRYVAFTRNGRDGFRDIMIQTSDDFLNWTNPVFLEYRGAPKEHLYTNAILPYERAPHILLGFPTRFLPRQSEQTEPTFMSSRDGGHTFHRWTEAIIPVTAPEDREGNRSNYMAWGLVELPGNDRQLSMYAKEAYYEGPGSRLRRFTYRVDGFVSVRAGERGGELVTKPLIFSGDRLVLNFTTAVAGSIGVELQDAQGVSIAGYTLDDCEELTGDDINRVVRWKEGTWLRPLAGEPVRLRFVLKDADLYSLRFR